MLLTHPVTKENAVFVEPRWSAFWSPQGVLPLSLPAWKQSSSKSFKTGGQLGIISAKVKVGLEGQFLLQHQWWGQGLDIFLGVNSGFVDVSWWSLVVLGIKCPIVIRCYLHVFAIGWPCWPRKRAYRQVVSLWNSLLSSWQGNRKLTQGHMPIGCLSNIFQRSLPRKANLLTLVTLDRQQWNENCLSVT